MKYLIDVCYHHKELLDKETIEKRECYDCKYYLKFTPREFIHVLKTDRFWKGLEDKVIEENKNEINNR